MYQWKKLIENWEIIINNTTTVFDKFKRKKLRGV